MVSFSQARDLYRMQREAKRIKKELSVIHVEAEAGDLNAGVKVVVSAEMEIVSITVIPTTPIDRVGALLKDALNRAMKKAQVISSEKMQALMSEMGMNPGQQ